MMFATLRNALLAVAMLVSGIACAQATTVLDQTGVVFAPGAVDKYQFHVSDPGTYSVTLTDLLQPLNDFSFLAVAITKGKKDLLTLLLGPGTQTFNIDKPGGYRATVFSLVSNDPGAGLYSLNVSAVPLPASVLLLGSALVGMLAMGRRRRTAGSRRGSES